MPPSERTISRRRPIARNWSVGSGLLKRSPISARTPMKIRTPHARTIKANTTISRVPTHLPSRSSIFSIRPAKPRSIKTALVHATGLTLPDRHKDVVCNISAYPSTFRGNSPSKHRVFGAQCPCPHAPLPTLHPQPRGRRCTARGETWLATPFVSRDFHPLPFHQFAWRSKCDRNPQRHSINFHYFIEITAKKWNST